MKSNPALRLDNQLCFALYAASRAMTQAYRPLLARLGLTYPQYLVLLVLWEHGIMSVGGLGERLLLDSGTLTPLLKRLERDGLIVRRRNAEDERVVEASLTAMGARLEQRAAGVPSAVVCNSGLPLSKLIALRRDVKRLLQSLSSDSSTASSHTGASK